jgi:hydroxymethylpyrimidine pyrophosphatase-like HAD family hydrolase
MPIRLVAIDLDGTLLNSQSEISDANRQALLAASERGVQLIVVTGRRFHSARPIVQRIPCPVTLISSNGALIGSSSGDEFVRRNFLPHAIARQVLEIAREYRPYAVAIFDVPAHGQIVMQEGAVPEGPLGWYLQKSPEFLAIVPELEAAVISDPVHLMFGGPPAHMAPLETLLLASAAGQNVLMTWTKYFTRNMSILDVMNKGCSKGGALKWWAERCGIHPSEVMAIGDNYNDREMLQFSGRPVVMGNCTPGLGEDGWPVTLTNDQDGVAAALYSYVLSKT